MTTVSLLANCEGKGVTHHRFGFFFSSFSPGSLKFFSFGETSKPTNNKQK